MGTKRHIVRLPERRIAEDVDTVFDDAEIERQRFIIAELGSATISSTDLIPSTCEEIASDKTFIEGSDYLSGTLRIVALD